MKSRIVLVLAVLFLLINLLGGLYALLEGELLHTCIHAVLTAATAYLLPKLARRRRSTERAAL